MQISRMLNEFENHRTETQYRNALIIKVIAFSFACYFAALYYYAYIATGTDQVVVENVKMGIPHFPEPASTN